MDTQNTENANFFALLHKRFADHWEAPLLTIPNGKFWTYGEVAELSEKIAGYFARVGLSPGERLLVQIAKSAENVALYLAALKYGLIYVPLNTAYTDEELEYFIADADPALIVCAPEREVATKKIAHQRPVETLSAAGDGSLLQKLSSSDQPAPMAICQPESTAVILYTSGTTGRSKGAMLTHNNLSSNALALHTIWGFVPGDVLLHALPIFHIHGLFVALHTAMLNGSEVLFLEQFDAGLVRGLLPQATVLMGVPTFYTRLLAQPDFNASDCQSVRLFVSGSAPLTSETFSAFKERTGHTILERYGMSEAGMITSNPLIGERRAATVGYALPDVAIRITDRDVIAPTNVVGMVEVKGPNIFKGYWRNPEKTQEAFTDDGWFKTGDLGSLSEDGRLTLSGRQKDLIIVGGYNVYAKEIETILDRLDGIAESAVIGIPHPDMGEGVIAVLVRTPEEEQPTDAILTDAVSALARFKQPRHFFWIDALPRNAMGKVQKQALRRQFDTVFKPM